MESVDHEAHYITKEFWNVSSFKVHVSLTFKLQVCGRGGDGVADFK